MSKNQEPREIKDILDALAQKTSSFSGIWTWINAYIWDIGGILVLALAVMTLIGILFPDQVSGSALQTWVDIFRLGLGWGSLLVIGSLVFLGFWMLKQQANQPSRVAWGRVFAFEFAVFSMIVLLTVLGGHSLNRARTGLDGGLVGWGLTEAISSVIGVVGTGAAALLGFVIGSVIGLDLGDWVRGQIQKLADADQLTTDLSEAGEDRGFDDELAPAEEERGGDEKRQRLPPEFRKQFRVDIKMKNLLNLPRGISVFPRLICSHLEKLIVQMNGISILRLD